MKSFNFISNFTKLFHNGSTSEATRRQVGGNSSVEHFLSFTILVLFLTLGVGNVWGAVLEITHSNLGVTGSYSSSTHTYTDVATIGYTDANVQSSKLRLKASGELWNTTAMPANIDSIVMEGVSYSSSSGSGFYLYGAATAKGTTTTLYDGNGTGKIKIDFSTNSYKFFYIKNKSSSRNNIVPKKWTISQHK